MHRRTLLGSTAGAAGLAALAGCSEAKAGSHATLERIVLRSATGRAEPIDLTLVYAPRDDSTERPVWGTYEAPASGETHIVDDLEGAPGVYSLTAVSQNHGSHEVVVRQSGDGWANPDEAGTEISISGSSE